WFSYNGEKIGQGRDNSKTYLFEHPEISAELEEKIRTHYSLIRAKSSDARVKADD
ncbi:MAG: DNA recombination/repair protein RecA, partial [Clostridia bacterium]